MTLVNDNPTILEECQLYLVMIPLFRNCMLLGIMITMKLVIMILVFNWIMPHMIVILLSLLPLLWMRRNLLMWRVIFFMHVDNENNDLCDSYIVELIHDATENYYEGGTYACRNCNNIKFPLYVLKILKLCLFYLPMLVDYCSRKLFAHKIPMHRKRVRLKCASHMLHDAPVMFQFLSFMRASLSSSCLARKALKKSTCWETAQYLPTVFMCPHD